MHVIVCNAHDTLIIIQYEINIVEYIITYHNNHYIKTQNHIIVQK